MNENITALYITIIGAFRQ